MAKIGVGLIGVQPGRSWAAVAHVPALRSLADDFEVVALSTTRQESANAAAEALGVPLAFASAAELAACPGVDVVAVTVKVPHHRELVEAAVRAGKHVFCEWPLGNGLEEARAMDALAREAGVKAVVGMQARFSPVLAYLRDLLSEGYVGRVLSVSVLGTGLNWGPIVDQPNAYTYDVLNGATLLSIPVGHTMDGLCHALGELAEVQAGLYRARESAMLAPDMAQIGFTTPDQVLFHGTLEGGTPISVHYRGGMPKGTGLLIEINGTEGDLQITGPGGHAQLVEMELAGARAQEPSLTRLEIPRRYAEGLDPGAAAGNVARLYKALAADLADGGNRAPDFAQAVVRHRMLEAIERSAETGRRTMPADC